MWNLWYVNHPCNPGWYEMTKVRFRAPWIASCGSKNRAESWIMEWWNVESYRNISSFKLWTFPDVQYMTESMQLTFMLWCVLTQPRPLNLQHSNCKALCHRIFKAFWKRESFLSSCTARAGNFPETRQKQECQECTNKWMKLPTIPAKLGHPRLDKCGQRSNWSHQKRYENVKWEPETGLPSSLNDINGLKSK